MGVQLVGAVVTGTDSDRCMYCHHHRYNPVYLWSEQDRPGRKQVEYSSNLEPSKLYGTASGTKGFL